MSDDFGAIPRAADFEIVQREYRDDYDEFVRRVQSIMAYTPRQATVWMSTDNPLLGGVSPVSMIAHGKGARLEQFVTEAQGLANDI